MVMIFGGGWNMCCIDLLTPYWRYFAAQGFVVFTPNYRLARDNGSNSVDSTCLVDVKSAIRWVRVHSNEYGVDKSKIVSLGSSAGGHLASCAGTINGFEKIGEDTKVSSRPEACILLWPVLDMNIYPGAASICHDVNAVSPDLHLSDTTPPPLVMIGTADPFYSGAQLFRNYAANFSFDCQFRIAQNQGHDFGFRMQDTGIAPPWEDSVKTWSMSFLATHNLLPNTNVNSLLRGKINRNVFNQYSNLYDIKGRLISRRFNSIKIIKHNAFVNYYPLTILSSNNCAILVPITAERISNRSIQ